MPKVSSKHPKLERTFAFSSFHDGYTEERGAPFLTTNQLSACKNMRYIRTRTVDGDVVTLKTRQGTIKISNSALPSSADIRACTYYKAQSKYILATDSKVYYLDSSYDPVELGSIDGVPTFTEFNGKLIIHDSGTTKYYDGTNFGDVNKYYQDEILGTGNGANTEFSGTVDHYAIYPSSLDISYTATDSKSISDNGSGRLTGDVDSAWVKTITNCADNGSGLIRVTAASHGFSTGHKINITGVEGTTEANSDSDNPAWTVTVIDANTFDLQNSTFTNAYSANGTASLNAVIYSTGAYKFKCSSAPDNSTNITADYKESGGAPKSKAGLVRASRLYTWGDSDNPSRITYSYVNDETATDSSSNGGYLDIDPNDGDSLLGALNFETSLLLIKENSLHRVDNYPGDSTFRAEKITDDLGTVSHRTCLFEGEVVTFLASDGWIAMHPSQRYGDIQKGITLSREFRKNAVRYANSAAYSAYNRFDKQLWLSLSTDGSSEYLNTIYVVGMDTGWQLSLYEFAFEHSSFSFVNNEMLIGGKDGNLYKLDNSEATFQDNSVSYAEDTYMRTAFTYWDLYNNWKHNKKLILDITSGDGASFKIDLYRNNEASSFKRISGTVSSPWGLIYNYSGSLIYTNNGFIGALSTDNYIKKIRFNYKNVMIGISDIYGSDGVEILGIKLKTAILGDK